MYNETARGTKYDTMPVLLHYGAIQMLYYYYYYYSVYLTCSKKLTDSQLSLPHEKWLIELVSHCKTNNQHSEANINIRASKH